MGSIMSIARRSAAMRKVSQGRLTKIASYFSCLFTLIAAHLYTLYIYTVLLYMACVSYIVYICKLYCIYMYFILKLCFKMQGITR